MSRGSKTNGRNSPDEVSTEHQSAWGALHTVVPESYCVIVVGGSVAQLQLCEAPRGNVSFWADSGSARTELVYIMGGARVLGWGLGSRGKACSPS
jgi:hypothetical protein